MTGPRPPGPADPASPPEWFHRAQQERAAQEERAAREQSVRQHRTPWTGSPGAMFPAAEDATITIQRITDEAVPPDVREAETVIRHAVPAGRGREDQAPEPSAATVGMKTASTAGVVRAGALMAIATVVSRVTGLLSKSAILAILATGVSSTAYTVANTLPNIVFELLIGGVLTSVAIPLLTRAQRSDPDGGQEYTERLLTLAVVGLAVATVVAVFCAPLLARLYQGNADDQRLTELTTQLGRLLLPQIFFYGIAALFGAILNTKERFAANAWAPALNNLVVIGVAIFLSIETYRGQLTDGLPPRDLLILGVGTTLGIAAQAAVMVPSLVQSGFRFRWRWGWDPRLTEAGGLVGWAIVYVLISQVGVVVTTRVANAVFSDRGGTTIFSYASLLFQMPYGILGVAVLTAIMPRLARHAAAGELAEVKDDVSLANRLSAVALLPVSAALIVLGPSVSTVLFRHGEVSAEATLQIGLTIGGLAIGLVPLAMTLVQMRVFYAMKDGRTPTIINAVMVTVRVPLLLASVSLAPEWIIPGLALSTAVSYIVGAIVGEIWLRVRFGPMGTGRTLSTIGKMILASAIGGGAAYAAVQYTVGITPRSVLDAVQVLAVGGIVGLLVIAVLAVALRVEELAPVRKRVLALVGRGGAGPQPGLPGAVIPSTVSVPGVVAAAIPPSGMGGSSGPSATGPAAGRREMSRSPAQSATNREQVTDSVTQAGAGGPRDPFDETTPVPAPGVAPATTGQPAAEPTPVVLTPGATVGGRYRLVSLVAVDEAGNRFWRARDNVLPRDMAVTLLPDTNATSATVARTLRVGRLHHIGLPQTLDVGTDHGQSYVVGQWVDGATLTDLLAGGPLDPDVATSITAKVSEAVGEAHRNGIALGAINPSLVRVNFDGQVRLSHVIANGTATTDQDVRAVGGLLYLMLTGTWPLPTGSPDPAAATGIPTVPDPERALGSGSTAAGTAGPAQLTPAPTRRGREVPAAEVRPGVPAALSALAERALHPDDPGGIHAVGAIAALLTQPETAPAAAAADAEESRPALNPAERRLVKERRVKLGVATVMIAIFSALIIIIVASLAKQVLAQVAGPSVTGVQKLSSGPTTTAKPTPAKTTPAKSTAPKTSGATKSSTAITSSSAAPAATVQKVVDATVYDPMGNGVKDYVDQVPQAFDGNPQTFWSTFVYNQNFPSAFKQGVGLTLVFGNPITPTSVTVTSQTPGITIQVRSAAGPDLPYAQTTAIAQGNIPVASAAVPGSVTIALPNAPKGKYLVLFVVHMAPAGPGFQGQINEISVSGY